MKLMKDIAKLFKKKYKSRIKFLRDKPLTEEEFLNVKFGHDVIAETLSSIIEKATPPFTIGLFGKWGTGKSTIVKILRTRLKSQEIPLVEFDVWKYKSDSLRRQFLITLDKELCLGLDYKKKLNQNLSEPYILPGIQTMKQILNYLVPAGVLLTVCVVIILSARYFFNITNFLINNDLINQTLLEQLFSFSFVGVFINMVLSSVSNLNYGTAQVSKTDSAEGFEDRFYEEVLPALKDKEKVVVAIDNLDRVDSKSAVDLLSDIKTFLSKDDDSDGKFIFLIACDDDAIKKHLKNKKFDSPDEFIRKFFSASIHIPIFLDLELDEYTKELLELTGSTRLSKNSNLIWLITHSYRNNPREIKQFINALLAHYLLVEKMEKSKKIRGKKRVTGNIEFLAKLMIIKQKMPIIYKQVEELAIRYGLSWSQIEEPINETKIFEDVDPKERGKVKKEYKDFLKATHHIQDENPALFIRLKQSEHEMKLPTWDSFVVAALSKSPEDIAKIFNNIIKKNQQVVFDALFLDYLRKISRNNGGPINKIWDVGSTVIKVGKENLPKIKNSVKFFTQFTPSEGNLIDRWSDFPPTVYFNNVYPILDNNSFKKDLVDRYLSILLIDDPDGNFKNQVLSLFEVVVNRPEIFRPTFNQVKAYISKYHNFECIELLSNSKFYKDLIPDSALDSIIDGLAIDVDYNTPEVLTRKLRLINKLYERQNT